MVGNGQWGVLGVESPDPVLSMVSSLGLAIAAGTSLLIDAEGGFAVGRTLGDIASTGPSLRELSPGRTGVAVVSGAGVNTSERAEIVAQLARHWSAIVIRCRTDQWVGPTVPVRPVIPGLLRVSSPAVSVWQPLSRLSRAPGDGPVLPPLRRRTVRALLEGRMIARSPWLGSWREIWRIPWA